jgi:cold shock CspA family protein
MEFKQGRVFQFDAVRRFGFIEEMETDQRWFFHLVDFNGAPVPPIGTPVAFRIGTYNGRTKATHIRPLAPEELLGGAA